MSYLLKIKTFSETWKFIDSNHEEGDFGSRKLLIRLFYEETMYQNRKQLQRPAVCFGQVEPQDIKLVNKFARINHSETLILISDMPAMAVSL